MRKKKWLTISGGSSVLGWHHYILQKALAFIGFRRFPLFRKIPQKNHGVVSTVLVFLETMVFSSRIEECTNWLCHDQGDFQQKHWSVYLQFQTCLVGGLEHQFYFPIYWECHHPNWLIFFRGVQTTNQLFMSMLYSNNVDVLPIMVKWRQIISKSTMWSPKIGLPPKSS